MVSQELAEYVRKAIQTDAREDSPTQRKASAAARQVAATGGSRPYTREPRDRADVSGFLPQPWQRRHPAALGCPSG